MIVLRFRFWQRLKILLGWYVQVELWPPDHGSQSYASYLLSPATPEREWKGHHQKIAAEQRERDRMSVDAECPVGPI